MSEDLKNIEEKMKVISKIFIKRKDIQILTGIKTSSQATKVFAEIKEYAVKKLDQEGKILPNEQVVPLELALEYLKSYGISKKKIYEDYERLIKLSKLTEK